MKARFPRPTGSGSRAPLAVRLCLVLGHTFILTLGLTFGLLATGAAHAAGTPEQRRACTPDVYRLCPGEIPNVRAITACLRRQKSSLSEACRAAFEQADTNPTR